MESVGAPQPGDPLPRALIVSEVMLFREGLRAGLARIGALEVSAGAPDDAHAIVGRRKIDIVILDASRPCALAHAGALRSAWPHLKLIAFGICNSEDVLTGAQSGICAFVGEDGQVADINQAALMALRDESYCSPRATACLIEHIASLTRSFAHPAGGRLTDREHEVASMVGQGLSNKAIAKELNISPATVKNHVHNILEKLQVDRRGQAAARVRGRQD